MIDRQEILSLVAGGEAVDREFKSDRQKISDGTIYEEIVAMANTKGGILLIGVEDDGHITGAQPRHGAATDTLKLQSAIFNNTVPNINTRISVIDMDDKKVIAIEIDVYPEPCATATGKSLRRTIAANGKPQTVPFYPRDQRSRRIDLGLLDFSAQPVESVYFNDLNPLEFERLRQAISRLRGDRSLLELSNEELAKALRLVESNHGKLIPNMAGLLLLGRDEILRQVLPTHELHFQVLDAQGNVKVNDTFHGTILGVLQEFESRFAARNEEHEVLVGLFRVPVPDYSLEGFREAVNNAVLHRDYTRMGGVYMQWQPDHLFIANPGGFPEGVTINNLLVHEPKPRNPRLAEAFKRIGLVDQTGRGVDKIFMGQLRYGRPAPDYSRSDADSVRVVLRGGNPSLQFTSFVYEQDKKGTPLTLDALMILNAMFFERRIDSDVASMLIQKGVSEARAVLENLHERGLIEAKGERKGRIYHLAASLYRRFGGEHAYVRTKGFDRLQQKQMIINAIKTNPGNSITREQAANLCQLSEDQASHLLRNMRDDNILEMRGNGRGAFYVLKVAEKTRDKV
jgi:ATP-dependent DNA helicase RecG